MADVEPPLRSDSPSPTGAPARRFWRRPIASTEDIQDRRYRRWAELWETIILAVATLATAWAGYEAGKWNSIQTALNLQATSLRIDASQMTNKAQELLLVDVGLFTNWVNAVGGENARLADFYQARFRDEFRLAFDAWIATRPLQNTDAPDSPFAMPEYRLVERDQAEALIEEAGQLTGSAEIAGNFADQYTLSVVIMAGSLLLAGLANRFEWAELRIVVVVAALLILLFSVINILRLPVA